MQTAPRKDRHVGDCVLASGYKFRLAEASVEHTVEARCLIGVLLIIPMGFVLGTPFPAAMARIEDGAGSRLVAWAWAANACGSVLGPLLAMMLAIDLGYLRVMLGATALYGIAYLVFGKLLWLRVPAGQSVGKPFVAEKSLVTS